MKTPLKGRKTVRKCQCGDYPVLFYDVMGDLNITCFGRANNTHEKGTYRCVDERGAVNEWNKTLADRKHYKREDLNK